MREITSAREIADALGGITALGEVCGVQYRLAYGYVDRDYIPARHDPNLVAALVAAGWDIDLPSIARWRTKRDIERHNKRLTGRNDSAYQGPNQEAQSTNRTRPNGEAA